MTDFLAFIADVSFVIAFSAAGIAGGVAVWVLFAAIEELWK